MVNFRLKYGIESSRSMGLTELYKSGKLVIDGSSEVKVVAGADGRRAFLFGQVTGLRLGNGSMRQISDAELPQLLFGRTPEELRRLLEGQFAFVVERSDGSFEISADRFGRMDLYYKTDGTTTTLATDLELLGVSAAETGFDQAALAHFFIVYGYRAPKKHTLYKGVNRLGVQETMVLKDGRVQTRTEPFAGIKTSNYGVRELNEYADTFLDSLRQRGSTEGNVVYLSSGWDSTTVLAGLVHIFGKRKVRAVTGKMLYSDRSGNCNRFEIERAKAVADYFGVSLTLVDLDYHRPGAAQSYLEEMRPFFKANQMANVTAMNWWLLAKGVARTGSGGEAVFHGETSDAVHNLGFSQFVTLFHPVQEFREYSDKMQSYLFGPTFLQQMQSGGWKKDVVYELLASKMSGAKLEDIASNPKGVTRQLLESFFLRPGRFPMLSLSNVKAVTSAGQKMYREEMGKYLDEAAEKATPETLYSWYLHLYNSFHWQGSTVASYALTAQTERLQPHLPFWDSRMHEFCSAMPEDWGRGLEIRNTKYPLKWMLQNRIDYPFHLQTGPHSYTYDVDPTFNHSAELLYASSFTPVFKETLKKNRWKQVLASDTFDIGYFDNVVSRYLAGEELGGQERSDLFALAWLEAIGHY